MAVGFPTKANWAAGDILTAAQMDDLAGTVNTLSPVGQANGSTLVANSANASGLGWNQNFAAGKNVVINGAMTISQRGTTFTPTTNLTYTLDRWLAQLTAASKFSVAQSQTNSPNSNGYSMLVTSLSAYSVAAGDTFAISQRIEGYNWRQFAFGTADAKTITLSFLVRSSLTGTFSGSLTNSAEDRSYPFTYAINAANTWEQKSVTIVGDTSGSWLYDNQVGAKLFFNLGAGATYSGTAGAWTGSGKYAATGSVSLLGTNAATLQISNVQLEAGSVATAFQTATGTFQGELAACQRYLPAVSGLNVFSGYAYSGTNAIFSIPFPVTARVAPTGITPTGVFRAYAANVSTTATPVFDTGGVSASAVTMALSITSGQGSRMQTDAGSLLLFTGCEL